MATGQLYNGSGNTFKIGKEVTPGTAVAPIEALLHTGFSPDVNYDFVESASYTGTRASNGSMAVGKTGSLSYPFEADSHNLGWVAKAALGSETILNVETTQYKHTFTMLNDSALPSFTVESSLGGAFHFTNSGVVCNGFSLDISPKAIVTGSADFIFLDQVTKGSPTALTPATPVVYTYNQLSTANSVKINGTAFGEIKSASIAVANNLSADDLRMGLAGKLATIPAGKHKFSGSMVIAYNANSQFLETNLATNATFALDLVFDTGVVLGAGTYKLEIHIPTAQISQLKKDTKDFIYYNIDFTSVGSGASLVIFNDKSTVY